LTFACVIVVCIFFYVCIIHAYNKFESSAMTVIMKQYGHMI
jgi:cbb3-type cytochrome oxidase subunit 3